MYKNHLNSYNAFIDNIPHIISELPTLTIQQNKITIQSIEFSKPYQIFNEKYNKITPQSCLEALETYKCKCELTIRVNNQIRKMALGTLPVMVGSKLCHNTVKDLSDNLEKRLSYLTNFEKGKDRKASKGSENEKSGINTGPEKQKFDAYFKQAPGVDTIQEPEGGYFIINGQEKIVRFLIVTKRHIPLLLERSGLGKKNRYFTDRAVQFRSVNNERGYNYFFHLCHDKNVFMRFILRRKEYTIPVILILKALKDVTDREIVEELGEEGRFLLDHEITTKKMALSRLEGMFYSLKETLLQFSSDKCDETSVKQNISEDLSEENPENTFPIANAILNQIFYHLSNNIAKFSCLVLCLRKLLYCNQIDDMDTTANQEIVGIGQLLSLIFYDKLLDGLDGLCKLFKSSNTNTPDFKQNDQEDSSILIKENSSSTSEKDSDELFDQKEYTGTLLIGSNDKESDQKKDMRRKGTIQKKDPTTKRTSNRRQTKIVREEDIFKKMKFPLCHKIEHFLNTGNMQFTNSTDMIQTSGLAISADRLNLYRFISQFESVNRGAFFSQLKTTSVRLLRPESYGFLCPVHTPDGSPCGLILHLSSGAIITHSQEKFFITTSPISSIKSQLKFNDIENCYSDSVSSFSNIEIFENRDKIEKSHLKINEDQSFNLDKSISTMLCVIDGEVLGVVDHCFIDYLRRIRQKNQLHFEIVEKTEAIYIFTQAGRLMRPVYIKNTKLITWIGAMEQTNAVVYNNENYNWEYGVNKNMKSSQKIDNGVLNDQNFNNQKHFLEHFEKNLKSNHKHNQTVDALKDKMVMCPEYFYREIHTDFLFSYVAATIPFLEYNQSPRNMYECQMVKQAMSYNTIQNIAGRYRCDNKAYSLSSLQQPLVTTNVNGLMGINVFIAVLCYTSYDMEDAMVLNMSSVDRGLFDGSIYKVKLIDKAQELKDAHLMNSEKGKPVLSNISEDPIKLPEIGKKLEKGDVLFSIKGKISHYKDEEPCIVHFIRLTPKFIIITLRIRRRPEIGDKFCSRHGQKGVMSRQMRSIDLPFNSNGLSPDLIINPHAFPSRMTIGMMMEILISHLTLFFGKRVKVPAFATLNDEYWQNLNSTDYGYQNNQESAECISVDKSNRTFNETRESKEQENYRTTPLPLQTNKSAHNYETDKFKPTITENEINFPIKNSPNHPEDSLSSISFSNHIQNSSHPNFHMNEGLDEKKSFSYEKISQILKNIGLNPFANELMISGVTGRPLRSLIFSGMCYYQRLRHMVLDKWQVRSTGRVDVKTRQPVKGRKQGGGVRFGEMEKAALIAHGTANLLQDRLMDCSDKTIFEYCQNCKTFLFVRNHVCLCGSKQIKSITAPFVLKYLLSELLAMNIFMEIDISE